MDPLQEHISLVKGFLAHLESLLKKGKTRNDAEVKDVEEKISNALDRPKEKSDQSLEDVIKDLQKLLKTLQKTSNSSQMIPDKEVLRNASGGLALEGVYKSGNPEHFLSTRMQLIKIPDSFSLTNPKQQSMYEQKEFSSKMSERDFTKLIERLGHSLSNSLHFRLQGYRHASRDGFRKRSEAGDTSSHSQEESYILHTKYNYIPLACGHFQKDQLKLSTGALTALKEIETTSDFDCPPINKVEQFYENYGSHVNQGPLHFGGIFWWRSSASGFRGTDSSDIKKLATESLDVYSATRVRFNAMAMSSKDTSSALQLRDSLTGKHREDLMSEVHLSVSKTGGPPEIDDHFNWKTQLGSNNKTWSVIDRGTSLIPVWEIVTDSHKHDFKDVSKLSRILMDAYKEITGEHVEEMWRDPVIPQVEKAEALMQSMKTWSVTDCESNLIRLLDFKTRLFDETGSHKMWLQRCLSNEILQNYLFEVVTANSEATAVNMRFLMRSLLDPDLYKVENFPNRSSIVKWAYQTEEDPDTHVSVSDFSELERILQCAKKDVEDSRHAFSLPEQEQLAKMKATRSITLSLNSFCKMLRDSDQKEAELLIVSILRVIGHSRENKTFNHVLGINEITFLQSVLHNVFSKYGSLREQCPIRAQGYLFLTALTVSADKDIKVSPTEKEERLQLILTELNDQISVPVKSVIMWMSNNWKSLEKALDSIAMGTEMPDKGTTEETICQLKNIQVAPFSEASATAEHSPSISDKDEKTRNFMNLLQRLCLQENYPQKMTKMNILVMDILSISVKEPQTEKELMHHYLYKLMMLDYRARYLSVKLEVATNDREEDEDDDDDDDDEDFFTSDDKLDRVASSKQTQIHPMDLHMAIFHCSNDFLRQFIYTKLSACQFGLPFLVPNPCTNEVEFPLWALRHIKKSWCNKSQTSSGSSGKYHNKQMFNTPVPIISFIRLGDSNLNSKSQILNGVINKQKHPVFFHRHCEGSTPHSLLMDGVVEIAWYCPGGKEDDVFDDCVAFLNLHGDAAEHPKQLEFLQAVSTVIVLLISENPLSDNATKTSKMLLKSPVPLICLFSGNDYIQPSKKSTKVRLAAKNRNQAELTKELISSVNQCMIDSQKTVSIGMCCEEARKQHFIVDEDKQSCKDGHSNAQKLMDLLKDRELLSLKENVFPLQGKLWQDWCMKDKEFYRLNTRNRSQNIEQQQNVISTQKSSIRKQQLERATNLNAFMKSFLQWLTEPTQFEDTHMHTLQWLRILLDDLTSEELASLQKDYHSTWIKMRNLPKGEDKESLQDRLNRTVVRMTNATIGLQHILRELSQLYETCQFVNKNIDYSTLPQIGATMLISGYPLELMNGDAAHVPLAWIRAVLDELIKTLGDKKVFVLSILGLQSSGKSTLLNTMFGLQLDVSAGKCTSGAFMQLLQVNPGIELGYEFVLIVDTEGLRSPELSTKVSLNHDNELATFIIGIGDLTVINIMGENPSEMHDILQICVQAFLRMKQVKITPSCIFVHQNVAESSAGDKNIEGRRRLLERLDEMAKMAAKEENVDGITSFSDVIHFDIDTQVFYFKNLLEGDPPMAPINPSYSQNVQELKTKLLTVGSWQRHSVFSSLSEFRSRVSDLWIALLQENFVFSFKNTVELMVYNSLEHNYSNWSWKLRKHSMELLNTLENQIGSNLINDLNLVDLTKEFLKVYEPLRKEIEQFFMEDKNKDTLIKWKANIDTRFKRLNSDLIEGAYKKCKEFLVTKQSRSELDQKRAKYMKDLTTQSKSIASTLKGLEDLTDTQIVEKFDELWINWTTEVLNSQPPDEPQNVRAVVEAVLLNMFQHHPNLLDKIKWGINEFRFDPDKHIQKKFLQKHWDRISDRGKSNNVEHILSTIAITVNEYITDKENAKKDFDENFVYEVLTHIEKNVAEFECTPDNPKFTHEFRVDLSVSHCLKNVPRFERMHTEFKRANEPLAYLQSKRETYFQSFKNYCKGSNSVIIFVDFLCRHIMPEVKNAANNKTCQKIAELMKNNDPALSGNRSNLENHILKHLAHEENFNMYKEYIDSPKRYFRRFIQEKINTFCHGTSKLQAIHQEQLDHLKSRILIVSMDITREVEERKGSASLWLNLFCEKLGELMVMKREELNSIENEDVSDWQFFNDRMVRTLENMVKDIRLDAKALTKQPTRTLRQQLQGCWAKCPFCGATCTNTIPNHDGDHQVRFHRSQALTGWQKSGTDQFKIDFCTTAVMTDIPFRVHGNEEEDKWIPYKKYREAGDPYDKWSITGDGSTQCYWKWVICKFQSQLENDHGLKFTGKGEIPKQWKEITKASVLTELDECS